MTSNRQETSSTRRSTVVEILESSRDRNFGPLVSLFSSLSLSLLLLASQGSPRASRKVRAKGVVPDERELWFVT